MLPLQNRFLKFLGQTSEEPALLDIVRAEGVRLYDRSGNSYIDLISGVSVSSTGHSNREVTEAVKSQVDSYMHLMVYGEFVQAPQVEYAEKLLSLLPPPFGSIFFVNSGSEAVEGALKLARKETGRKGIVSFENGYHGSTYGALSVQGSDHYSKSFGPLLPAVKRGIFNHFDALDLITEEVSSVIVEPIQAEAGVVEPHPQFLESLRERCNETGTILIFDECQTGLGRTGKGFAFEHYGVVPDIIVLAKALGGGMPLGAFVSSPRMMKSLSVNPPLGHITTFGGHPVCCAAGLASLNYSLRNDLAANASDISQLIRARLDHPAIKEIRGRGLLLAIELASCEMASKVVKMAPRFGIVVDLFLFRENSIRVAPPLTINMQEAEEACSRLLELIEAAAGKRD